MNNRNTETTVSSLQQYRCTVMVSLRREIILIAFLKMQELLEEHNIYGARRIFGLKHLLSDDFS